MQQLAHRVCITMSFPLGLDYLTALVPHLLSSMTSVSFKLCVTSALVKLLVRRHSFKAFTFWQLIRSSGGNSFPWGRKSCFINF